MELKEQLQHIFNGDYPGTDIFLNQVIRPILGDEISMVGRDLQDEPKYAQRAQNAGICKLTYVADITDRKYNADNIAFLDITLSGRVNIERSRVNIQQLCRSIIYDHSHLLMVFHYENVTDEPWRFSYAYKQKSQTTSAKRFTYVFGKDFRSRTAAERFKVLSESQRCDEDFINAFSVEALSNEFFNNYRAYYAVFVEYITGEHYSDEKKLANIISKWNWLEKDSKNQFENTFASNAKDVRDYIKKMFGRIVFLYFLQRKGWLYDNDGKSNLHYMHSLFEQAGELQNTFLDDVLEPLFFYVLNTKDAEERKQSAMSERGKDITILPGWQHIPYLNGGLFTPDEIDPKKCTFPSVYFKELFEFLDSYNFTIDENDQEDAEIGIDPEMLGRIFENLLEDNKDKGAFYTPKPIVDYMCRESIIAYLQTYINNDEGKEQIRHFVETLKVEQLDDTLCQYIEQQLTNVKICDPAIGSGAFPMGMVSLLSKLFIILRKDQEIDQAKIKRDIIQNNIYGVDIEKGAVDIARLRFWLALVVDEVAPRPLPNLDYKIMCGNSLLHRYDIHEPMEDVFKEYNQSLPKKERMSLEKYKQMVADYTNTSDHKAKERFNQIINEVKNAFKWELSDKKKSNILNLKRKIVEYESPSFFERIKAEKDYLKKLKKQLKEKEAERDDIESNKLYENAFEWRFEFPQLLDDEGNFTGFDIVIGNPPYINVQLMSTKEKQIYKTNYTTFFKRCDMFCLFYELGLLKITANRGIVTMIIPSVIHSNMSYKLIRNVMLDNQWLQEVHYTGGDVFNTPTVDTTILICNKNSNESIH